jgi:heme exporter protein D
MQSRSYQFETQSYDGKRWLTESLFDSEQEARAQCASLLRAGKAGMRILKETTRGDNQTENIIYTEMRAPGKETIRVMEVESAPVCERAEDVFNRMSRLTIFRVLRQYFEKVLLTPTEVLHNYKEFMRLQDFGTLVVSAVGRVAAVQAVGAADQVTARRTMLNEFMNVAAERARVASTRKLPDLQKEDFGSALRRIEAAIPDRDESNHLALVVLSKELVNRRNWLAKLEYLLQQLDIAQDESAVTLIDGVVADVLNSPECVQDLLGRQPDLMSALCTLIDIIEGRRRAEDVPEPGLAEKLSAQFETGSLPQSREAVLDFIVRQVRGTAKLNHGDPTSHQEAYRKLAARLLLPVGMTGGPPMGEALAMGYGRFLEQGGAVGKRLGVEGATRAFESLTDQVRYLLIVAESDLGREQSAAVLDYLVATVLSNDSLDRLVSKALPLKTRLRQISDVYELLRDSALPEPQRTQLADKFDDMLAQYIVREKIIERLDDPKASLRIRATMLVQFLASNVLSGNKAVAMSRDRVISHLRQPEFEKKFIADIPDPSQQAVALRDFHSLLRSAGLG